MRNVILVSASVVALASVPLLAWADAGEPAVPQYSETGGRIPAQEKYEIQGWGANIPVVARSAPMQQSAASPHLASDVIGATVIGSDGRPLGEVQDLVLSSNGAIDGVILAVDNTLGFGAKWVGLDMKSVQPAGGKTLTTSITRDQLSAAPDFSQQPILVH